jgi:RNA-binding protein YhbY
MNKNMCANVCLSGIRKIKLINHISVRRDKKLVDAVGFIIVLYHRSTTSN